MSDNVNVNNPTSGASKYVIIAIVFALIVIIAMTLIGIASDTRDEQLEVQQTEKLGLNPELNANKEEAKTEDADSVNLEETASGETINGFTNTDTSGRVYGMTTGAIKVAITDSRLSNVHFMYNDQLRTLSGTADVNLEDGMYEVRLVTSPGLVIVTSGKAQLDINTNPSEIERQIQLGKSATIYLRT